MELITVFSAAAGTAWNRAIRGPKLPGWTFTYEFTVEMIREFLSKPNANINEVRQKLRARDPIDGTKINPISINGMKAEWVVHESSANSNRIVLYLHGGIYILMAPQNVRNLTSEISKDANAKVLAIDYRLAPENPFPAAIEDAVKAYNWLLHGEDGPKAQPSQIVIAGDSAGGGLTFGTLLKLKELGIQMPAAACGLSPWVDLTGEASAKSMKENREFDLFSTAGEGHKAGLYYAQTEENLKNPLVSPIFGDLSGLPPILIQAGSAEVLRDEIISFDEKLKAAGVESKLEVYSNMVHVFQMIKGVSETAAAFKAIGEFVKQKTSN